MERPNIQDFITDKFSSIGHVMLYDEVVKYSQDQDKYIDNLKAQLKESKSVLLGVAENLDDVVQENIKLESQLKERNELVLKIVNSCFHMYASNYRKDAEIHAKLLLMELTSKNK